MSKLTVTPCKTRDGVEIPGLQVIAPQFSGMTGDISRKPIAYGI